MKLTSFASGLRSKFSGLSSLLWRLPLAATLFAAALTARAEVPTATLPAVDHYVYLSFLPKASELAQDAKINGLTILRIDETADRVIVSYQYPDGRTATLGYALLGSNVSNRLPPAASPSAQSTARYTVSDRDPEVIYVERPSTTRVVYTDPYYYNYWSPWTVGFGLGWSSAYYSGYPRYYYGGGGHGHGGHYRGGHGGHRGGHGHGRR